MSETLCWSFTTCSPIWLPCILKTCSEMTLSMVCRESPHCGAWPWLVPCPTHSPPRILPRNTSWCFRKTDFVWCVCGGEKDGLGRQNLPLTECWQLAPPGVSWQQVFSTLCSEVPTAGGHEEENHCAACPGASCLLPHLSTEGCGHVTFKLWVKRGSALVYCYKYGLH